MGGRSWKRRSESIPTAEKPSRIGAWDSNEGWQRRVKATLRANELQSWQFGQSAADDSNSLRSANSERRRLRPAARTTATSPQPLSDRDQRPATSPQPLSDRDQRPATSPQPLSDRDRDRRPALPSPPRPATGDQPSPPRLRPATSPLRASASATATSPLRASASATATTTTDQPTVFCFWNLDLCNSSKMTSPTPSVNYSGSATGINAEFDFDSEMPSS
nr:putative Restriction enzyme subunit alpha [Ipomoea trifida]